MTNNWKRKGFLIGFFSIKEEEKSPSHNDVVSQSGLQNKVEGFAVEANFPICALSRPAYIYE